MFFQPVFEVAQLALGKGKVFDLQGFAIELAAVPDACMIHATREAIVEAGNTLNFVLLWFVT